MELSTQTFKTYLTQIINDPSLEIHIDEIIESFSLLHLPKNDFLVEEGHICKYFCYLEEGVLQHAIDIHGEEKTTYLALQNTTTAALKSFKQKFPSRKNIKAICDCTLRVIDLEQFNFLMKNNKGFRRYYHNLIENQIFLIDDYRINLLTLAPEERYKNLLETHPNLFQQVPLHYLASFLGISTRHLSRIRKNII
ncbi:MAG: Crp/Fnr family transcriptional regulator [Flavobacteriaceae bacterium]|nr:Crp/Fnr family transcriptional regulator [Flavobacteriaceae bacterium]